MKVKLITDGTVEGTKLINLRTGEEVKNLEIVEIQQDKYSYENDLTNIFHSVRSESNV